MENIDEQNIIGKLAKTEFVVFAGTGCVKGIGIPPWKTLNEELQKLCNDEEIRNTSVNDIEDGLLPRFAQKVHDYLSENNRESEYNKTIREKVQATESRYSVPQIEIIRCTGRIITTNFDDTFEKAYRVIRETKQLKVQSLPNLDFAEFKEGDSIVYLHGRVSEEQFVSKESDYDIFYPSVSISRSDNCNPTSCFLEDFLKQVWMQETLVFIGFSFADKHLLNLFQTFSKQIADSEKTHSKWTTNYQERLKHIQHYAFLPDLELSINSELQDRKTKYESYSIDENKVKQEIERRMINLNESLETARIKPIRYKEHVEYQNWLDRISGEQRKIKSLYQEEK